MYLKSFNNEIVQNVGDYISSLNKIKDLILDGIH